MAFFNLRFGFLALFLALPASRGDMLEAWNNAMLDSFRTENTHPCVAARSLAIMHGAMFDAHAAVKRTEPFYTRENVREGLPLEPALNSAAFTAATNLFPSRAAAFRELYDRWNKDLPDSPIRPESIRLGRTIADAWIAWRSGDGSSGTLPYIPSKEPGAWRRTPPFFRPPEMQSWARVVPFALVSAAQFRPPGPPVLSSDNYAKELNTLKELGGGGSARRTAYETETAKFWSDFSYTVTPPGHWNQVAQSVAVARRMSLEERIRMFAVLNISMNDVAVACWDAKYVYNFWRPVTAIRAADTDGNPATEPDPDWMPLLNTPAFPEYVSGHSAFSAAGAVVLARFNGGDQVEFSVPSDSLPGKVRTYKSLWACAEEVSQSRLYGGIHFPSALTDGLALGRRIAEYILQYHFSDSPEGPASLIVSVPGELNRVFWMGLPTRPGRHISIERLIAPGRWEVWTNAIASAPTIRWPVASIGENSSFRVRQP